MNLTIEEYNVIYEKGYDFGSTYKEQEHELMDCRANLVRKINDIEDLQKENTLLIEALIKSNFSFRLKGHEMFSPSNDWDKFTKEHYEWLKGNYGKFVSVYERLLKEQIESDQVEQMEQNEEEVNR